MAGIILELARSEIWGRQHLPRNSLLLLSVRVTVFRAAAESDLLAFQAKLIGWHSAEKIFGFFYLASIRIRFACPKTGQGSRVPVARAADLCNAFKSAPLVLGG